MRKKKRKMVRTEKIIKNISRFLTARQTKNGIQNYNTSTCVSSTYIPK